jgi:hypothetical protein
MGTIANLIMRLVGLGKAVDALDGETSKAYIGGVGMMLSGAATLVGGLANLAGEIVPLHGGAAYFDFARNLSHDPNAALVLAGAGLISKGVAEIGQRHATAKLAAQMPQPAAPPAA